MDEFQLRQFDLEHEFDGFSVFKLFASISIILGLFIYIVYCYC